MASRMFFLALLLSAAMAEDPYLFFDWKVTYGPVAPLAVEKPGILINGQFPGPPINCTTNNNIIVNVFNHLDEPLLLTWSGIQQRKNCWMDGVPGTMCPIMPGKNFTYKFQAKDQIGTYFYFPTTALHRAAGGIGMFKIHSRPLIPVPFDKPAGDFSFLVGDWYNSPHKALRKTLDSGRTLAPPNGIHINGKSGRIGDAAAKPMFTMEMGKTYRYRVCNVGMMTSINFRLQNHHMKVVEVEGSHTVKNDYNALDLHVGQCLSVLITADQPVKDYYFVVSSRFSKKEFTTVAVIRYATALPGSASPALPPPPPADPGAVAWSMNQFRSFRWNLTASAARPNPQGSFHYGKINITRTIKLVNTRTVVDGKTRFAINGVSHVDPATPVKLAEYFGVLNFKYDLVKDMPPPDVGVSAVVAPSVVKVTLKEYLEIILENHEDIIQVYNLDGYAFFGVGMDTGIWSPEKRKNYNLLDATNRHTAQVYPKSWTAILVSLDNAGMWNLRSEIAERAYLGQQLYLSVRSPEPNPLDEFKLPENARLCGKAANMPRLAA